jgi:[ribosomal protein S5]-alanine N-acetyltransferase
MPEIERLRPEHAPALLAFERANREYFAGSIPDRGDDYFEHFDARLRALLGEQAAGECHFHVLLAADGSVVGRINLMAVADGAADLGYRIAQKSSGQGLAQRAVLQICELARTEYGLTRLRAAATTDNAPSRAVLARTGFVRTGETTLNGRAGLTFEKVLA